MPRLRTGCLKDGLCGERYADVAALDHPSCRLQARAQEGVRRAPEPQSGVLGFLEQAQAALAVEREWLLAPDVLARAHRGCGDLDVRRRDGEVDDDLHIRVPQREFRCAVLGDPELLGPCPGGLGEDVGDHMDLEVRERREVVQVVGADDARADDGDADRSAAHRASACAAGRVGEPAWRKRSDADTPSKMSWA